METKRNVIGSERFLFHYYGYPGFTGQSISQMGRCPVEIATDNGKTKVTITEPEESKTSSVMNRFEHIATRLYQHCLLNEAPGSIEWFYHDVKDMAGRESIREVVMKWDGEMFLEPKWLIYKVIADYRVDEVSFTEKEIVLKLGFEEENQRTVRLPLAKYPVLLSASEEQRDRYSRGTVTVIDWYELGFKLDVRDVVLENAALSNTSK